MTINASFLSLALMVWALLGSFSSVAQEKVRRNVEIEWEGVDGASLYEIQITRREEDSNKKTLLFKLKEPKWSATVRPGTYDMQVRSFDDRGAPGDWGPPSELVVKLPAIVPPHPRLEAWSTRAGTKDSRRNAAMGARSRRRQISRHRAIHIERMETGTRCLHARSDTEPPGRPRYGVECQRYRRQRSIR